MKNFLKILLVALLVCPSPSFAWGQLGHRIIGEIAEKRVSGKTAAEVELILGGEDLAEISTWADEERANPADFWQKQAGPWHYVTIPQGKSYADTTPPREGDALTALKRFTAVLRDKTENKEQRRLALHFIVHIVGDVHQPLHAGNGTDRGGNDELVQWYGEDTNLHAVWDTKLIDNQKLGYIEYTKWLDRQISAQQTIDWWEVNPNVWVDESAALRDTVYPESDDETPNLRWDYQYKFLAKAEQRLQQGGVRLAAYLDWVFASK